MAEEVKVFNVTLLVPPEKFGPLFAAIEHLNLEVEWNLVSGPRPAEIRTVERTPKQPESGPGPKSKPKPKPKPIAPAFGNAARAREIRDQVAKNLAGKTYTWGEIVDEFVRLDSRLTRKNLGHIITEMVVDGMIDKLDAGRYAIPLNHPSTPPAAKPATVEKKLPEGSAKTILIDALKLILPGTDVSRTHMVRVMRKAGMTESAFDVRRQELISEGWLEQVGPGTYRRLQHPSEPSPSLDVTSAKPSAGTAPVAASTTSNPEANPTPLPDRIPGFSKASEGG